MTDFLLKAEEARRTAAADWVVRLQADDLALDDALAFDAWLDANPRNIEAYDSALGVMQSIEGAAPAIAAQLVGRPVRRAPVSRGWLTAGGLAAAAAAVVAILPFAPAPVASQTYVTGKGEHRAVRLADGSLVELNGGSRLTVTLERHARRVSLPEGEAVFDVAADKSRPFLIAAGDRTVRVVGTRFDVRERSGALSVVGERGGVEVRPAEGAGGRAWRLHPGQRLDHMQGVPAAEVSAADPAQAFSWRTGRLIYRDQPLSEVVADLNAQFPGSIRLEDPALGAERVSGVLVLDDKAAVIRRLALLVPIRALPSGGEILLRRDTAAKP